MWIFSKSFDKFVVVPGEEIDRIRQKTCGISTDRQPELFIKWLQTEFQGRKNRTLSNFTPIKEKYNI